MSSYYQELLAEVAETSGVLNDGTTDTEVLLAMIAANLSRIADALEAAAESRPA